MNFFLVFQLSVVAGVIERLYKNNKRISRIRRSTDKRYHVPCDDNYNSKRTSFSKLGYAIDCSEYDSFKPNSFLLFDCRRNARIIRDRKHVNVQIFYRLKFKFTSLYIYIHTRRV